MSFKPLDLTEDIQEFDAHTEEAVIRAKGCQHKDVKIENGELSCSCGAGWIGAGIHELYDFLKKR